jgi:hypothetical protein
MSAADALARKIEAVPPPDDTDLTAPGNVLIYDDVEPQQVEWLWPGRIPLGKLTILEGMPDVGKSHLTCEIAAAVSTGRALPGGRAHPPGNVLFVALEDDVADTQRPRADAAGADLKRLALLTGVGPINRPISLPQDVGLIAALIRRGDVRLLVIDPITNHLGQDVNANRDTDVRRALAPLATAAADTGAAILIVRHRTKQQGGDAILAGAGTLGGFVGLARSVLLAAKDPDDETRAVLAVSKCNLARKPESLLFTLEQQPSGWARVSWNGITSHSANDLIAAGADDTDRSATAVAVDCLREWLSADSRPKKEIEQLGKAAGIAPRTLERAAQLLKIKSVRSSFGGPYLWELPADARQFPRGP